MFTTTKERKLLVAVGLVVMFGIASCSDDDPTGPVDSGSPIPLSNGTAFRYQMTENIGIDDTCDVLVETISTKASGKQETRWVFDYHGIFDTLYMRIGDDSAIQYIGIVPRPDTGIVSLENKRFIFEDLPLFEIEHICVESPLRIGMTWDPFEQDWLHGYFYSGSASVSKYDTVTVLGQTYSAFNVTIDISTSLNVHSWNHLIISAYICPGTGLVAVYNSMYQETYPNSQFIGVIGWELVPPTE